MEVVYHFLHSHISTAKSKSIKLLKITEVVNSKTLDNHFINPFTPTVLINTQLLPTKQIQNKTFGNEKMRSGQTEKTAED